jgi:glycyl-tRNA synthetase beta chain
MQSYQDLIIEIGTEELPPMSLNKMSEVFSKQFKQELNTLGLSFGEVKSFATPRRIAVLINNVSTTSKIVDTKAHIEQMTTPELIPSVVAKAISNLPSQKMQWGGEDYVFARPIHWILALFGSKVIRFNLFGIDSGNVTYGHRFLSKDPIIIRHPNEYEEALLTKGKVIVDFFKRKKTILDLLQKKASELKAECLIDNHLLEQVTNMVEYPDVLSASFDEKFLKLPLECLKSVMGNHQKSFALIDQHKKLIPYFLLITNMFITDNSRILIGNQKVMHARLQDAMFLYEQDLQTTVEQRLEKLKNVTLEEKLGNLYDQSIRISVIAEKICQLLNSPDFDLVVSKKAALLCKTDLVSNMVIEFPELQGIMGAHYIEEGARQQNKIDDFDFKVATAIREHYLPKNAEDVLPREICSLSVAISYRLNLLCGMFSIGAESSGAQDPFALRRHAIAIIRMLIEKRLDLNIIDLFKSTLDTYQKHANQALLDSLLPFFTERLRNWYVGSGKYGLNIFYAVLPKFTGNLYDFDLRMKALSTYCISEEFAALSLTNKRVNKILQKNQADIVNNKTVEPKLFSVVEEKLLFAEIAKMQNTLGNLMANQQYGLVFKELIKIKPVVEEFFAKVMVMVSEIEIRHNRLCLLQQLRDLLSQAADLSAI